MPDTDYLPNKDAAFSAWLANFINVASDNVAVLHLTTTDINAIQADATAFSNSSSNVLNAKNSAKAATATRKTARKTAVTETRTLVKRIQNIPGISDDLKLQLGITVAAPRRHQVPVYQPAGLVAKVAPDLRILLRWAKGENHYGTSYIIERKCGTATTWTMIDKITATHFYDDGCPPGTSATYRVTATRGVLTSMPSLEVSVFP